MNKVLTMTEEEFEAAVEKKVEHLLSSKEEAEAHKAAEEALSEAKTVFEQLKAELESKKAKIQEYEEVLAELNANSPSTAEVAANERVVELETQLVELTHRAEIAEAALETLAREETAAVRMSELEESGVSLEGDDAEKQYAKIREMSDDEFTSYKQELIALRARYASNVEEEEDLEIAELSESEINMIAQSLGCDPADAQCISLVREVAEKMSEVSKARKKKKGGCASVVAKENSEEPATEEPEVIKETASVNKLSFGEAVSRSLNREFQPSKELRKHIEDAWRTPSEEVK